MQAPIKTFANQNQRAKVRLELEEGVVIEVPLNLVIKAIAEQHLTAERPTMHLGAGIGGMVHLVVTRRPVRAVVEALRALGGSGEE